MSSSCKIAKQVPLEPRATTQGTIAFSCPTRIRIGYARALIIIGSDVGVPRRNAVGVLEAQWCLLKYRRRKLDNVTLPSCPIASSIIGYLFPLRSSETSAHILVDLSFSRVL